MSFFFKKKSKPADTEAAPVQQQQAVEVVNEHDDVAAIIALALSMYINKEKEHQNATITIERMVKPYSPWSSKIHGLRQQPIRIPGLRSKIY